MPSALGGVAVSGEPQVPLCFPGSESREERNRRFAEKNFGYGAFFSSQAAATKGFVSSNGTRAWDYRLRVP